MTESMAKAERKAKKRNFTQCEVEVLVGEVEKRKAVLFGGYSAGVANAKKAQEWQHVADNVNAVTSEGRSVAEVKKKWCDIKVDAKKHLASHRQSTCATDGGTGQPELTLLDEKLARGHQGDGGGGGQRCRPPRSRRPWYVICIPIFEMSVNQMHSSSVHTFMYRN